MKVQKIKLPGINQFQWIVIGIDYLPVEPISQYLFFLASVDRSPYTIRTYAHHLKIYWEYLARNSLNWEKVGIEELARFVASLNGLVDGNIVYLKPNQAKRSSRTINQIMVAVASFYQYQQRIGNVDDIHFHIWKKSYFSNQAFKPLLHHLTKSKKRRESIFKLKEKKTHCKIVAPEIIKAMVKACKHLRDKLLICLLYESGCRIGQALGLRHEDIETFNNIIKIQPRDDNTNFARAKTRDENTIHVSEELMQLYCDYYMSEVGDIDSDYVFINLWEGEIGKPISYNSVITLFQRLSKKISVHVTPHMLRHTHATELIKAGWGMVHVQHRLGHRNIQTTINTYTHLTQDDMKEKFKTYLLQKKEKN